MRLRSVAVGLQNFELQASFGVRQRPDSMKSSHWPQLTSRSAISIGCLVDDSAKSVLHPQLQARILGQPELSPRVLLRCQAEQIASCGALRRLTPVSNSEENC